MADVDVIDLDNDFIVTDEDDSILATSDQQSGLMVMLAPPDVVDQLFYMGSPL